MKFHLKWYYFSTRTNVLLSNSCSSHPWLALQQYDKAGYWLHAVLRDRGQCVWSGCPNLASPHCWAACYNLWSRRIPTSLGCSLCQLQCTCALDTAHVRLGNNCPQWVFYYIQCTLETAESLPTIWVRGLSDFWGMSCPVKPSSITKWASNPTGEWDSSTMHTNQPTHPFCFGNQLRRLGTLLSSEAGGRGALPKHFYLYLCKHKPALLCFNPHDQPCHFGCFKCSGDLKLHQCKSGSKMNGFKSHILPH